MRSLANRATRIWRDHGLLPLLRRAIERSKYEYLVYRSSIGNGYTVAIGGKTANLSVSSVREVLEIDYILKEEEAFMKECLNELNDNDVVWDIGANIGVHSCLFGGSGRKIISIEPYPPNTRRLQQNIKNNDIDGEILSIALSDRNGIEELSVPAVETPGDQWPALVPNSISDSRHSQLKNKNTIEIDVRKGDTLVKNGVNQPSVVKVDVEGSSHKVIRGLKNTLRREKCRLIYVEVHLPNSDEDRPSVADFGQYRDTTQNILEDYGFKTEVILERDADFFVKGYK
jgi:FkbM family methyltransferase